MTIGEAKLHAQGPKPKLTEHLQEAFDELHWQQGEPVSEQTELSRQNFVL